MCCCNVDIIKRLKQEYLALLQQVGFDGLKVLGNKFRSRSNSHKYVETVHHQQLKNQEVDIDSL